MSKDKFKRSNVNSTILKKVVIRMDFIGLTDIIGCVDKLKNVMNGKFTKFRPIKNNNYNVELNTLSNSEQPLNVNLERKTLYLFTESIIGPSKANFMLGPDFAYIEINCSEDYEGCDRYIKLMAEAIDAILKFDTFISVKRLGLRKVDLEKFDNVAEMNRSLETPIWENYKLGDAFFPLKKVYSDLLYQKNVNTVFRIQRIVQEVLENEQKKIQYTFDIDSYKDGNLLVLDDFSTVSRIENTLLEQMNEPVFKYFIATFKEQYIDKFYHE